MSSQPLAFLKQLLATPGPSGDEAAAARLFGRAPTVGQA
jgi:hypothetical protein